jgi:peptidoglycan/LPS O-acetylase OafA/YrhL
VSDEPTDAVPVGRPQPRRTSSLERLRRRTTSGRYIPEIDGLRFICIMLVVLLHIQEMTQVWLGRAVVGAPFGFWRSIHGAPSGPVAWVVARGDLGVYVFFMISGFVLALPFAQSHRDHRETPSLSMYFVRRLTRIEPPYLAALVVSFALAPLAARAGLRQLLPHLGAGAVYSHAFVFGTPGSRRSMACVTRST